MEIAADQKSFRDYSGQVSERARVCTQWVSHAPCTLPARPSLREKVVVGPWAIADPLYCLSQIHAHPHSLLNALSLSLSDSSISLLLAAVPTSKLSMFQPVFLSLWSVILALRPANNNINRRAHPCPRKGPDKGVNLVVAPDLNALMMMMGMINGSNNEIDQRS